MGKASAGRSQEPMGPPAAMAGLGCGSVRGAADSSHGEDHGHPSLLLGSSI